MPHERGLLPVLLSEFSIPALADPKGRCRSRPTKSNAAVNRIPPNLLTQRHFNLRPMPAAGMLGSDSGQPGYVPVSYTHLTLPTKA